MFPGPVCWRGLETMSICSNECPWAPDGTPLPRGLQEKWLIPGLGQKWESWGVGSLAQKESEKMSVNWSYVLEDTVQREGTPRPRMRHTESQKRRPTTAIIKKSTDRKCWRGWRENGNCYTVVGSVVQATMENGR